MREEILDFFFVILLEMELKTKKAKTVIFSDSTLLLLSIYLCSFTATSWIIPAKVCSTVFLPSICLKI